VHTFKLARSLVTFGAVACAAAGLVAVPAASATAAAGSVRSVAAHQSAAVTAHQSAAAAQGPRSAPEAQTMPAGRPRLVPLQAATTRGAHNTAAATQTALTASTCYSYYLIGSRGSGQGPAGTDQYDGLGPDVYQFSERLSADISTTGASYGYEANTYPAVSIGPAGSNTDGWFWNLTGVGTALPIGEYQNSVNTGVSWLTNQISLLISSCPTTKILLAGFSQGAQVTGNAYQALTSTQQSHIFGVFLLADPRRNGADGVVDRGTAQTRGNGAVRQPGASGPRPLFNAASAGKVLSYCRLGDPVCQGPFNFSGSNGLTINYSIAAHTSYTTYSNGCNTYPQEAADYFAVQGGMAASDGGPVASLDPVDDAIAGEQVTISAADSCDPDGEALSYEWNVEGATGQGYGDEITATWPSAGTYTVSVTVTNSQGESDTATQSVTVSAAGTYTGVPQAVTNVVSTPAADGESATLTWNAATSGPPTEGYKVLSSDGDPLYVLGPGNGTSVTFPDIDLPLSVMVVPVNRVGEGPASAAVTMYSDWPPSQPGSGSVCTSLSSMFDNYGNAGTGADWTGGDGTNSIALPNGETAWFFSDTFLGTVNSDGSRPTNTPLIHNSIVLQSGSTLSTITGGTASSPQAVVDPAGSKGWWWNGDGIVNGNTLQVFYGNYESDGSSALSFAYLGSGIATFSLPSMTLTSFTQLDTGSQINWGTALVNGNDGYTYIYGTESSGNTKYLHIARAPAGELLSSSGSPTADWQYWTNNPGTNGGWSSSEGDSARVLTGVDTGFSVKYLNGQFVLVTMDSDIVFSSNIFAYFASSPTGPFTHQTLLYSAPEASSSEIVYDARLHPEQNCGSGYVVSYNVNSLTSGGDYSNVANYRPRFIEVNFPGTPDTAALPDAPTDLQATVPAGTSTVDLTWDAPTGPNDTGLTYRVYQRNETTGQTQYTPLPGTVATTSTSITLPDAGVYDYRVTAINSAGEGPPSQMTQADVTVPAPTTAPTGLTASAQPDGTVNLTWTPITGGAGWISYNVYEKDITAGATSYTLAITSAQNDNSATVTSLTMGDTYDFTVAAYNSGGTGPMSSPASAVPAVGPPTNLTATANSDGSISLSWKTPVSGDWYWLYMCDTTGPPSGGCVSPPSPGKDNYTQFVYPDASGPTFTATGLTGGHKYNFYVTAIGTHGGTSVPSNVASATATLPVAPTGLSATANDDASVTLNWTAPSSNYWYYVFYNDDTANPGNQNTLSSYTQYTLPDTSTTFTATSLYAGHKYSFYVESIGGGSSQSVPSSVVTVTVTIAAPTDLQATPGDGDVLLQWTQGLPGQWYWVYENGTQLAYPVTKGTTANIGGLTDGTKYSFYVTTIGPGGGQSAPSNTVSVTPRATPPNAPTGLTATSNADGSISLSWNSVASGDWYWIYAQDVSAGGGFVQYQDPDTTTSFTASGLNNGDQYEFYVETIGTNGAVSQPSDTVAAWSALAAPTGLTATANKDGSVALKWTAPAGQPAYFWVYVNGTRLPDPVYDASTFTDTGLTTGQSYSFCVTAAGNDNYESPCSNTVSITPTLAAVTNLSATVNGYGYVTLTWTPPITGAYYWVYYKDTTAGGSYSKVSNIPASDANDGGLVINYGLNGSDTYSFYLVTAYGGNLSGPSNVVSPSRAVTVPTGLTGRTVATSAGDGQCESIYGPSCEIQLKWNAVTGADHYDVYRLLNSAGQTSYSYIGSAYGTTYNMSVGVLSQLQASYEIKTVRTDGGVSATSGHVTVTIGDYGGVGTDCYLLTQVPYESGSKVYFNTSATCPDGPPYYEALYSYAVVDNVGQTNTVETFCYGTSCSVQSSLTAESGTHSYCTGGQMNIPTQIGDDAAYGLIGEVISSCVNLSG
jgi:fibronectin type 3 domain-containing protein